MRLTRLRLYDIPNQPTYKVSDVSPFGGQFVSNLTRQIKGKCQGLTIIPYNSGHTLGGTIWKIRSPSSGTIIYAVDLNHTRERHLDGTIILRSVSGSGVFVRPDLLITDAERALVISSRRKDRDSFFLGMPVY